MLGSTSWTSPQSLLGPGDHSTYTHLTGTPSRASFICSTEVWNSPMKSWPPLLS